MMGSMTLDIEDKKQLVTYLQSRQSVPADEIITTQLLAGGVSNRTMLVTRRDGTEWVIKQALSKLRVQVDWFSDPIRIHREAAGLRWLENTLPTENVPTLVFDDEENHIIGMTAVPQPHENWKTSLLQGIVETSLVRQFAEILAQIHRSPLDDASQLKSLFSDRTFFESLRVEPYYVYSATQVPQASQFLNALIEKTRRRQFAVVHGDYSPKNVLVYENKLVILDYEVIHLGDPAFDLGFSLTHLLSKAHHVKMQRQAFLEAARFYWQTYLDTRGAMEDKEFEPLAVDHTLACLLARVVGRSPLEYLDSEERDRQKEIVLYLIDKRPRSVPQLIEQFGEQLVI
ncbi:MAG: aminoglycoside phosphotransferase family protein [Chloroflexota bacterium]